MKDGARILSFLPLTFAGKESKIHPQFWWYLFLISGKMIRSYHVLSREVRRLDLNEELAYKIAFTIGPLQVPQYVVVTWGIMAFLVIFSIVMTRNLKLVPGKRQVVIEGLVSFLYKLYYDILGEKGKRYIPYLGSVCIFLAVADGVGLLGISPPTRNLNVTVALAILAILLVQVGGIQTKGGRGWLKGSEKAAPVVSCEHPGPVHPAPVSVPPSLRQRAGGRYHHGPAEQRHPHRRAAHRQRLLRHLRRALAGLCVLTFLTSLAFAGSYRVTKSHTMYQGGKHYDWIDRIGSGHRRLYPQWRRRGHGIATGKASESIARQPGGLRGHHPGADPGCALRRPPPFTASLVGLMIVIRAL